MNTITLTLTETEAALLADITNPNRWEFTTKRTSWAEKERNDNILRGIHERTAAAIEELRNNTLEGDFAVSGRSKEGVEKVIVPVEFEFREPMYTVCTTVWDGDGGFKVMRRRNDDLETSLEIAKDFVQSACAKKEGMSFKERSISGYPYSAEILAHGEFPFAWVNVEPVYVSWPYENEVWHVEEHTIGDKSE